MTKNIGQAGIPNTKAELPLMPMLASVAMVGAIIGSAAMSAHDWADYGFIAVETLLMVGLIRSIAQHIEKRLPRADATLAHPQDSDAQ